MEGGRRLAYAVSVPGFGKFVAGTAEEDMPGGAADKITGRVAWEGSSEAARIEAKHQPAAVIARSLPAVRPEQLVEATGTMAAYSEPEKAAESGAEDAAAEPERAHKAPARHAPRKSTARAKG